MTNYIYLPKGSIMTWNSNAITEHNRQPIAVSITRIENSKRMANGTMRKYWIADKRKWDASWQLVPDDTTKTVDGKWGGTSIENFYNTTPGQFTMTISTAAGAVTYIVMFTSFTKDVVKRGNYNAWNVSVTIEEV